MVLDGHVNQVVQEIGKLPNPDPSDTAPWNKETEELLAKVIAIDPAFEASRGDFRRQAQEWAGLDVDPTAELFVFVGRWSNQKGVDLIADVFPAVLEKHSKVQVGCYSSNLYISRTCTDSPTAYSDRSCY